MLPDFLQSTCTALEMLELACDGAPLDVARLGAVAAALPGLARLTCQGFVPALGVPAHLRHLTVSLDESKDTDLEVLVVQASALSCLEELDITLYGGSMLLRAANLSEVQLRKLRVLHLHVDTLHTLGVVDLSYLADPARPFALSLSVWSDPDCSAVEDWVKLLQILQVVLLPQDVLVFGVSNEGFSTQAQALLQGLRLKNFRIELPAQSLMVLPEAEGLEVCFNYLYWNTARSARVEAAISWGTLRMAGRVLIEATAEDQQVPALRVCGYLGGLPPPSHPWRLHIRLHILQFKEVSGLPPQASAAQGSWTLQC